MSAPITSVTPISATTRLRSGGVIAYPTEAVWGLGCDPHHEAAVMRLLAIKQRAVDKGVILVASSLLQLQELVDWDALPHDRIDAVSSSWPGPHTWLLPVTSRVPHWITGSHDTVAVRTSAHPVVIALCNAFGGALVSTSANLAGEPPPRTRDDIAPAIIAAVDAVVGGETGNSPRPSTIRDARSGALLRN